MELRPEWNSRFHVQDAQVALRCALWCRTTQLTVACTTQKWTPSASGGGCAASEELRNHAAAPVPAAQPPLPSTPRLGSGCGRSAQDPESQRGARRQQQQEEEWRAGQAQEVPGGSTRPRQEHLGPGGEAEGPEAQDDRRRHAAAEHRSRGGSCSGQARRWKEEQETQRPGRWRGVAGADAVAVGGALLVGHGRTHHHGHT
eukprot:scaffold285_cov304-Pinguiococcus_pyrenoidosus.AAC.31